MIINPFINGILLAVIAQDVVVNVAKGVALLLALLVLRAIIYAIANSGVVCVLVNTGSEEEAVRIGRTLVEERLAAAVNITQPIRSFYRWQGRVEDRPEILMVLKTTRGCLKKLTRRAAELHSYQVPCIVALSVLDESHRPYLDWIKKATGGKGA